MKTVKIVILGLLFALPTTAQKSTAPGAQTPHRANSGAAQVNRSSKTSTSAVAPSPQTTVSAADQETSREWTHRIQKLELEMIQKSEENRAINPASAAIFVGILALIGQFVLVWREDRRANNAAERAAELAKEESIFRQTEKFLEFRLKQMEQFYAPMRALLGQSKGLYDKMLRQLEEDEPTRYRRDPQRGSDDYRLQVLAKDSTWQDFRLLDQLPAVRNNPKALALAEGILHIGEKMTTVISEHAGLASEDVIDLLGEYLAHHATISMIYKLGETVPYEPGWHKMGYYPRLLNPRIEAGYRELSQFINKHAKKGESMLEALPPAEGKQKS